jgi:hypothetical protein
VSGSTNGTGAFTIGKSFAVAKKNSSQGASSSMPCPSFPFRPVLPAVYQPVGQPVHWTNGGNMTINETQTRTADITMTLAY